MGGILSAVLGFFIPRCDKVRLLIDPSNIPIVPSTSTDSRTVLVTATNTLNNTAIGLGSPKLEQSLLDTQNKEDPFESVNSETIHGHDGTRCQPKRAPASVSNEQPVASLTSTPLARATQTRSFKVNPVIALLGRRSDLLFSLASRPCSNRSWWSHSFHKRSTDEEMEEFWLLGTNLSPNLCAELVDSLRTLHSALAYANSDLATADLHVLLRDSLVRFILRCVDSIEELNYISYMTLGRLQMARKRIGLLEKIFKSKESLRAFLQTSGTGTEAVVTSGHEKMMLRHHNSPQVNKDPLIVASGIDTSPEISHFVARSKNKMSECSGRRGKRLDLRRHTTISACMSRHLQNR